MAVLFLTEDDVRNLMDMETSIQVVEDAFRRLGSGVAENVPRARAHAPGIYLHTMSAADEHLGLVGWKAYTTTARGGRFHVAIYDSTTGEMVALVEADYLGQLRTGAASGVATDYMARPDCKVVGIFGSGRQARTQLKGVCSVRRIEQVEVYSRDEQRRRRFAEEMSEYCNANVVPVRAPDTAAAEKDIVITATTSKTPLFDGRVLDEGTHLNVIGSNFRQRAEIDVTTVRRADSIACDSIKQCQLEAGDFREALEERMTDWSLMRELAEIVVGKQTGRPNNESITLFKSVGLAIEDVAMAAAVVKLAKQEGLGRTLPL